MSACINPSKRTNQNQAHAIHMMPMPNLELKILRVVQARIHLLFEINVGSVSLRHRTTLGLTYLLHLGTSKSWPQPLSAIFQDHMMSLNSVWDAVEFQKMLMLMYISIFSFKKLKIELFFVKYPTKSSLIFMKNDPFWPFPEKYFSRLWLQSSQ